MKYCLSGRQSKSVLKEADEIKMRYSDIDRLIDYIKEFPNKIYIIDIPYTITEQDINWKLFAAYAEEVELYFALNKLDKDFMKICIDNNIKYYYNQPIFTWNELEHIIQLGVDYVILTDSLYFSIEKVKNRIHDIKIRLCPTKAYDSYIPRDDGVYGCWIRPEDVYVYEKWVDVFEFNTNELSKEATYLQIYRNQREWPGNLNLLIENLNINVDNRAIPKEIGERRANCGLRCMESRNCHLCENAIKFANSIRKKHYRDNQLTPVQQEESN